MYLPDYENETENENDDNPSFLQRLFKYNKPPVKNTPPPPIAPASSIDFVRESLKLRDLQRIKLDGINELFINLPLFNSDFQVDPIKTSRIDFSKKIGRGFQGSVYLLFGSDDKVVKLMKLRKKGEVTNNEISIVVSSMYASNIGVGPTINETPFITSDGEYVAIIMDKVVIYNPNVNDVNEIILLFDKMIENKFMTFDMEFGKTASGKMVIVDFGVSGFYPSKYEALKDAINNDMFANTGSGYYNKAIEDHFKEKMNQMKREIEIIGGKNKRQKTNRKKRTNRKKKRGKYIVSRRIHKSSRIKTTRKFL
jgi:hypothetical protein